MCRAIQRHAKFHRAPFDIGDAGHQYCNSKAHAGVSDGYASGPGGVGSLFLVLGGGLGQRRFCRDASEDRGLAQ